MPHYHQKTGEVLKCQYCRKPATKFIAGLYPVCDQHGEEYLSAPGETTWDKMRAVKDTP